MGTRSERRAAALIRWRWAYVGVCAIVTVVMVIGARRVRITTSFFDLMPTRDPLMTVFRHYLDFGSPLSVQILLKVRHGTIYSPVTLRKIYDLTRDVDLLPGVDHERILSIATTKVRATRAVAGGVQSVPVMSDEPPTTQAQARAVRERARSAVGVMGLIVSPDESATLLSAAFNAERLDYEATFHRIHQIGAKYRDADTELYPAGLVMLTGWVYHYGRQTVWIFVLSFVLIALALADYMRSVAGIVTPLVTAVLSALWGVGAAGWLGLNIDPLAMVIPVLLIARALSHSVQITRRYYEILDAAGDQYRAAAQTFDSMLPPAALGVLCDAAGLYMLLLVRIPLIRKLGLLCGTWSMLIIPTVIVLTPAMLAILPPPADVKVFVSHRLASISTRLLMPLQFVIEKLVARRWRVATSAVLVPLGVVLIVLAMSRTVGNLSAGSALLWPDNEFNVAVHEIGAKLAGVATLDVIWQGKQRHALLTAEVYESMRRFQERIERSRGAEATLSIADNLPPTSMVLGGGNPKWLPVDPGDRAVGQLMYLSLLGSSLKDMSLVADSTLTNGTVKLWYKDLRSTTVAHAMSAVRAALVPIVARASPVFEIKLATGPIALQYATDRVVRAANRRILLLLLVVIFLMCAAVYRSLGAALMLLVPLIFAQFGTDAVMYLRGLGLNLNTLPVIAVGLGVGIDYGIYLLSRICDEYQEAGDQNAEGAVDRAIFSTGEAILFVALTLVVASLPWFVISGLRFLANMGLMLALVMAFNAILALIVLPLLVGFIKPRFLSKAHLMRH